ncbi:MAG: DUF3565 domain-containing protein [Rhodospirillaceae bacterium]
MKIVRITGYHQDDRGHWIAELACGHQRHVRREPLFRTASWVITERSRLARVGQQIPFWLCARDEAETSGAEAAD